MIRYGINLSSHQHPWKLPRERPCTTICAIWMDLPKNCSALSLLTVLVLIGCTSPGLPKIPEQAHRSETMFSNQEVQPLSTLEEPHARDDSAEEELQEAHSGPLTLGTIEQLARRHNPTLMQAVALIEGEKGKVIQAGLWPNPLLGYVADQLGQKGTAGEFQGGFIQQKFVTGGKLRLSQEKYQARVSASEAQAAAQIYLVLNGVRIHYYRTLGMQRRVAIQRELLKTAEDNLVTAQEMFNIGQANRADLHHARVVLEDQELSTQMADNELRMQWEQLATVVGLSLPSGRLTGELEGDLQRLTFEEALQHILAHSPQLAEAKALLKSDQIKVQRELVEPIPNLFVRADVGRNYTESQTVGGIRAWIEVPIFDWNQGTVLQAKADMRRQEHQVQLVELQLRRSLAEQFQKYLTALQHVRAYQTTVLPQAEAGYAAQLKSYQEDRLHWPDVLEAQRELSNRRLAYVDQLMAWRTAQVTIDGLLLVDGLTAPGGVTPRGHIDATPKPR